MRRTTRSIFVGTAIFGTIVAELGMLISGGPSLAQSSTGAVDSSEGRRDVAVVEAVAASKSKKPTRISIPKPYDSWKAQTKAEAACSSVDDDSAWEVCLIASYKKSTGYELREGLEYEATTDGFKVKWSKVVLPSGGKIVKKEYKVANGIPSSVYCKMYSKHVILCNNGSEYVS